MLSPADVVVRGGFTLWLTIDEAIVVVDIVETIIVEVDE